MTDLTLVEPTEGIPYPLADAMQYAARFGNTDPMNMFLAMYGSPSLALELREAGLRSLKDTWLVKGDRDEKVARAKAGTLGAEMNASIRRQIPSGVTRMK